jgi:hypothetical protein
MVELKALETTVGVRYINPIHITSAEIRERELKGRELREQGLTVSSGPAGGQVPTKQSTVFTLSDGREFVFRGTIDQLNEAIR